jgi:ABC-2 type transport system permease protein
MSRILTLWRREMTACFLSPVAYVTMVAFLLIAGATFLTGVVRNVATSETLASLLFGADILWLTPLITVIAMRLFAEEQRSGTLEALMTAPVTEAQVVLGKYAGALSFLLLAAAPTIGYPYVLAALCPATAPVDAGAVWGGALVVGVLSAFCLAIGLLISLMTRNQIIAAICTFCAIWFVLLFGWLIAALPFGLTALADYFSALEHIESFVRGVVDTRPLVLYVSGTCFLLFLSVRVLESRRWI